MTTTPKQPDRATDPEADPDAHGTPGKSDDMREADVANGEKPSE